MTRQPVNSGPTPTRPVRTIGKPDGVRVERADIRTRHRRQGGGFSLIELIAVSVMLGVSSIVAIPSIASLGSDRESIAAQQLLRDLSFARQRAVASGTRAWVVFDTGAQTWSVLAEDPSAPGRAGAAVIVDPATGQNFIQSLDVNQFNGVQLVTVAIDGDVEIGFDWLGQPLNAAETPLAATGSVTLTGTHVVNVAIDTGYVTYVPP